MYKTAGIAISSVWHFKFLVIAEYMSDAFLILVPILLLPLRKTH